MTTSSHSGGAGLSLKTGDEILGQLGNPHSTESTIAENSRIQDFVAEHRGLAGGFFYGVSIDEAGHRPDVGFMPSEGLSGSSTQVLAREAIEHAAPDVQ